MINLGLIAFVTLKYPLTQFPLPPSQRGEEKGNNTHPLFRKTDNTNRIPWKRGYSPTDKKSISLPFLGTGRAHSQRSLQFVIPIFLTLCRTLAEGNALVEVEGIRGNVWIYGWDRVASVFEPFNNTMAGFNHEKGGVQRCLTTNLFRISG